MIEECWLIGLCGNVSMIVDLYDDVLGGVGVHGTVSVVAMVLLVEGNVFVLLGINVGKK